MRAHGAPNVVDHPALPQHVFHAGPELAHPAKGAAATRSRRYEIAVESKLPSSGALLLRCTPLTRNAKTANWQKVPARAFSVIKIDRVARLSILIPEHHRVRRALFGSSARETGGAFPSRISKVGSNCTHWFGLAAGDETPDHRPLPSRPRKRRSLKAAARNHRSPP